MSEGLLVDFALRRSVDFDLDIQLEVRPGETVAVLGPNGAGKSTAIDAIAGLVPVDSGSIRLEGKTLDDPGSGIFVPPEDRHIGVVLQDGVLFPHLDVTQNVAFGLRSRGMDKSSAARVAGSWTDRLGLEKSLARAKPGDLSGGQAQKVALARALAIGPAMLLLDEPLSALDVTTRSRVRRELSGHLADFAGPRLLVTHDPSEAFLLADRIYILEHGRITQSGTADELRLRPRTAFAADFAGVNLLRGVATGGVVQIGEAVLDSADPTASGDALVTIRPNAVSIHDDQPHGSPRNTWQTAIDSIEPYGERCRVQVGGPLPLTIEITKGSADSMGLRPGKPIWVAVKATEISVEIEQEPRQSGTTVRRLE